MPPPSHDNYLTKLAATIRQPDPDSRWFADVFRRYSDAVVLLAMLDLEPARPTLSACYATRRRGNPPRDPIVLLRVLLLAVLIGETSLNRWVPQLRNCRGLRAIAGLDDDDSGPGVGTLYDFLHRLHDGAIDQRPGRDKPSDTERRRAASYQPAPAKRRLSKRDKRKKRGPNEEKGDAPELDEATLTRTAAQVVEELRASSRQANPNDLLGRLSALLFEVAVRPSAARGLIGDVGALVVGGDSSTLPSGAQGRGKRTCEHSKFERCDCDRIYADPDARIGWDSHRRHAFFGYRFYEVSASGEGHDLPLAISLEAANISDMVSGPRAIDQLRKTLRDRTAGVMKLAIVTLDAGHDALPIYSWLGEHGIRPVIPLSRPSPGTVPQRPDLKLSERGVPLCQAGVEMAPWGSAGENRPNFICPLKAGLARCPLAPDGDEDWRCRPELKHGPTVAIKTEDNPRLFPAIHRNSSTFTKLRNQRSGTERSNGMKKGPYRLVEARHRRRSFWLIRLHLIAMVQHAKAWCASTDAAAWVEDWLTESRVAAA